MIIYNLLYVENNVLKHTIYTYYFYIKGPIIKICTYRVCLWTIELKFNPHFKKHILKIIYPHLLLPTPHQEACNGDINNVDGFLVWNRKRRYGW